MERIRAHLGTGSPNTVTRHLETWWASVGARLRQRAREQGRPDVPAAVDALAQRCWAAALEAATEHARAAVAGERAELHAAQAALASQQDALAHERTQTSEQLTQAQHQARTAEASAAALREQRQQLQDQRDDLRRQRDGAYTRNELLEGQVAALRTELAQKADQHSIERDELLAHLRATEDRALAEVDRARQALQQLQHSATTQARQHQRELSELSTARQQAEQASAHALRERDIQRALASAYASQLERLGDLPEQVRAALTPPAAPVPTKPKPPRKARSR
ncbi:DNA-binding protein [Stenotrophomonas lactitubi]|uniref:DNA-binding protein n=1 Tax=Stenotrophomonas lactitubi TaxID=2045214 RepID=A0AAW4GDU4_9GAMM|nr:DNA-binding protein [Stenotrophomonas lactitubi]MBM9920703.1 DNA-binding protein [Stenotrophomonas lactitubi]MBM9937855.1 DNA-binding protein [Stenotrophomonas lactitubi]